MKKRNRSPLNNKKAEPIAELSPLDDDLALLDLDDLKAEKLEERLSLSNSGCVIETQNGPVYKF